MDRIIIFGNSASGKSTLAKSIEEEKKLSHLDLDTLAWQSTEVPMRRPLKESQELIKRFMEHHKSWVIEGCYGDLIEYIVPFASEMIFLNPTLQQCVENAQKRAWEPHKYESKEEQDANLDFLISWIKDYDKRDDMFSRKAHMKIFSQFTGKKKMIGGVEVCDFCPSDAPSLFNLFYETIRDVNIADYSQKQVEAWALTICPRKIGRLPSKIKLF